MLMVASFVSENWCSHIRSQYYKSFLKYHEKRLLTTIDGTITYTNFIANYDISHSSQEEMLLTNVLLVDNFIKRYQTSEFIGKLITARLFCK